MARCMLIDSKLPKNLWTYAVMTAAYVRNRCFNPRLQKTGFEAFTGNKPSLSHMHIFGTVCYAYVQMKKKLDVRSTKGVFVGYDKGSPAYLVYFPETGKIKRVRCVKFSRAVAVENCVNSPEKPDAACADVDECVMPGLVGIPDVNGKESDENEEGTETKVVNHNVEVESDRRYPKRVNVKLPNKFNDYVVGNDVDKLPDDALLYTIDYCYRLVDVPHTFHQATHCEESVHWQNAMENEMEALKQNDTYELTCLPQGREAVGGRWVNAAKLGHNNEEKFKARYVAKGYSQLPGIDYQETFSPTARITSIRMLAQLVVQHNLTIHQMDVKSAYLNAPIDCEIYVQQPEGFVVRGDDGEKWVWKLKKSLYGLKQSGRNWNNLLHGNLMDQGFSQSLADPCLYTRHGVDEMTVVVVWVDDIIIASSDVTTLRDVKQSLSQQFDMHDLGELSWFLGIQFTCGDDFVKIDQTKYVEKILSKFGMSDCKPRQTPCEMKIVDDHSEKADGELYRKIVGSLIYVMTATRPDLCFAVTKLSQHMSDPSAAHFTMAKHVLRYLKGTADQSLVFKGSNNHLGLVGHCDADWANSPDRRSITGYAFQLAETGPMISWKSKKQQTIALSTCEAEYMAITAASQEAKFLMQLLSDMTGRTPEGSYTLHCDNQGAIALAKNPVQHQRSKHIDIKYHYIRSEIQAGSLNLVYVPTEQNIADVFTKPVTRARLQAFTQILTGKH